MSEQDETELYVALLVYGSTTDGPSTYEEETVLVRASSVEEATEKARRHGRGQESTYEAAAGNTTTWTLLHVVDVAAVLEQDFSDTAIVYARHFRDYDSYCAFEPLLGGQQL